MSANKKGKREQRWFYRNAEEFNASAEQLKQTPCPHCKVFGALIRHGYLHGFDESSQRKTLRARRIFCSNRNARHGCGRTFSVWRADKIRRLGLTTGGLWRFLQRTRRLRNDLPMPVTATHGTVAGKCAPPSTPATTSPTASAEIKIFDLASGKKLSDFKTKEHARSMAASPDGKELVGGGDDGVAHILDSAASKERLKIKTKNSIVVAAAFSPNGKVLALADSGSVKLFDPASGKQLTEFEGETHYKCLAFSSDGKNLASGNNKIFVWNVSSYTR